MLRTRYLLRSRRQEPPAGPGDVPKPRTLPARSRAREQPEGSISSHEVYTSSGPGVPVVCKSCQTGPVYELRQELCVPSIHTHQPHQSLQMSFGLVGLTLSPVCRAVFLCTELL